jgi:hypothetical protein
VFGLQPSGFNIADIPPGQYTFLGGLLPSVVNLYTATTTAGNGSLLELIRTRGTFNSTVDLVAGDFLGGVNFGAPNATGLSSVGATVLFASGSTYSSNLVFQTTQVDGSTKNTMVLDDFGYLSVASGYSPAVRQIGGGSESLTVADEVIVYDATTAATVTLPSGPKFGKRITIVVANPSTGTITVQPDTIVGDSIIGGNITLNTQGEFVTLIYYGSDWFIISR